MSNCETTRSITLTRLSSQGRKKQKKFKIQVKGAKENLCSSKTLISQQSTLRQKSMQNLTEGIKKLKNKSVPRIPPSAAVTPVNADLNLSLAVTEKKYSPPVDVISEKHIDSHRPLEELRQKEEVQVSRNERVETYVTLNDREKIATKTNSYRDQNHYYMEQILGAGGPIESRETQDDQPYE